MGRTGTKEWIKIRKEILSRDGKRCRHPLCSVEGNQVHHAIPFRISKDNNILNQVLLCPKHHAIADNTFTKYGRTSQVDIWLRENFKNQELKEARSRAKKRNKYQPGTNKRKKK